MLGNYITQALCMTSCQACALVIWGAEPESKMDLKRRQAEQLRRAGALGGAGIAESSPPRFSSFRVFSGFVERYSAFYAARTLRRFASLFLYRVSLSPEANISTPAFFNDSVIITNTNQKGAIPSTVQGNVQNGEVSSTTYLSGF